MRWGFSIAGRSVRPATLLLWAFSGGLVGFYYQIHQVFLANSTEHIPSRTSTGFVVGAGLSLLLCLLVKICAGPAIQRVFRRGIAITSGVALSGAILYACYILFQNTEFLFRYDGTYADILRLYPAFAAATIVMGIILRFTIRGSLATSTMAVFLLATAYILIKTGSVIGVSICLFYYLYLILLGRLAIDGIARLVRLRFDSALETLLVSFVLGILANYVLWYTLGQLSLLYAATVYCTVLIVLTAGLVRHGISIIGATRTTTSAAYTLLNHKPSLTTCVLLNVTLFCLLLLIALLTIKFPGNEDSSARMYCATVFKFAEMHRTVFLPFYQHWPLIFQPLLLEISGLPPFLAGGITALRFFHGSVYFSFIPFIILLCKTYRLSYRTLVLFLLIIVASSSTFGWAYFDKPNVIAFPAFISLLVISLVMLVELKTWHIVLLGAQAAIISNSKLVLVHGAILCIAMLAVYFAFNRPTIRGGNSRRAVILSLGIFLAAGSLHAIQNTYLRGNPVHPFAAELFSSSRDYPEELRFARIPSSFYEKTMPTARPSHISTLNLDSSRGMYRPFIHDSPDKGGRGYGITATSVTIAVVLVFVLLPIILLIQPNRVIVFCGLMVTLSFFIWFGWIGDGLRYSAFLPSIALLGAVLVGKPVLANRYFDLAWRYLFYGLLVFSIPIAIYFSAGLPTTGHLVKFLLDREKKHESLDPGVHVATTHLREQSEAKPVLLVADMTVSQYGFFQPNFVYQPIHWRKDLFTNMVYLTEIKPTHLLTVRLIENSILTEHYPFLADYLTLETELWVPRKPMRLYRFEDDTPWEAFHLEYRQKEEFVPGHIEDIKRVLDKYRS